MRNIRKIAGKSKDLLYRAIFCLSGDAKEATDHKIPMTQELFEYLFDFYLDMDDQRIVMKFMGKYPQFVDAYVKRVEEELSKTEPPGETPEQAEARWQKLCARIRARHGEDAI